MKLYVYVSESIKLSDLVPITESLKIANSASKITGIFSYSYGHYLQIIEGESEDVDKLVQDVQKDKRHQNVSEILNVEIEQRFFSDWTINLVPLLKRNDSFIEFTNFVQGNIDLLSRKQKRLFNVFYKLEEVSSPDVTQEPFDISAPTPLVYSIKEWPNFDIVEPTSSLMSLCGLIMNNPMRFYDLTKQHFSSSDQELRLMLNELNKSGYLEVSISHDVQSSSKQITQTKKTGHFQKWRKEFRLGSSRPQIATSLR